MNAEEYMQRVEAELREQAAAELLRRSLWEAVWKQRLDLEDLYLMDSGLGG